MSDEKISTPNEPAVRSFEMSVSEKELTDLRNRLSHSRLLPGSPGRPASALEPGHLADLVAAWRGFDWRRRERWLAAHPQVLVDLGDVVVHAAHLRSADATAPAILVMHGWPHTFALQLDFADLLPDFHVVVASLPGFAFSSTYASGPQTDRRIAETMHALMRRLGYDRYLTYGEDVSANINDLLAGTHPESVTGIVVTHAHFPTAEEQEALADPAVAAFFSRLAAEGADASGYAHLQATRPDTLAAALNDSPAGLLAWIVEKLVEWSDTPTETPRRVEDKISRERIFTEAMIYWHTQSIGTSFRPYFERATDPVVFPAVTVPAAIHIQRHEHDYPESAARAFYRDIRVFDRLAEGGHFAVAEVPQVMAGHVRTFVRGLGLLRS